MSRNCPKLEGDYYCSEGAYKLKIAKKASLRLAIQIDLLACYHDEPDSNFGIHERFESRETYFPDGAFHFLPNLDSPFDDKMVRTYCENKILIVQSYLRFAPQNLLKEHHVFSDKEGELIIQEGFRDDDGFSIRETERCFKKDFGTVDGHPGMEMETFRD